MTPIPKAFGMDSFSKSASWRRGIIPRMLSGETNDSSALGGLKFHRIYANYIKQKPANDT